MFVNLYVPIIVLLYNIATDHVNKLVGNIYSVYQRIHVLFWKLYFMSAVSGKLSTDLGEVPINRQYHCLISKPLVD